MIFTLITVNIIFASVALVNSHIIKEKKDSLPILEHKPFEVMESFSDQEFDQALQSFDLFLESIKFLHLSDAFVSSFSFIVGSAGVYVIMNHTAIDLFLNSYLKK